MENPRVGGVSEGVLGYEYGCQSITSGVPGSVSRSFLAADSRESDNGWCLLSNTTQHVYRGDIADVVCDLELSIGTGALGMDHALRDTLTVEMGKEVDQMEVLEQQRALSTNALPLGGVVNGSAIGSGVHGLLVVLEGRGGLVVSTHCGGLMKLGTRKRSLDCALRKQ